MKTILTAVLMLTVHALIAQKDKNQLISELIRKMTTEEKIGQLNLLTGGEATTGSSVNADVESKILKGSVGGIFSMSTPERIRKTQELAMKSRLQIPIIFGMDVIHGYRTVVPIPLGLAATWDMDLIQQSAKMAAQEATADGICWTFSPMVDICRDPRWGRIAESAGEDPYLGSQIARAMVRGYQGNDLKANNTLASCVKHFALYGAAEAGRDYNSTDMSLIKMYNEYLPPYKAALDAGSPTIMASFNDINGTPATANKWLLTDLLRKQWGFKGMVVTDYTGIKELTDHGLGNLQTVSAKALQAGIDMDMVDEGFLQTLKSSLDKKIITEEEINTACRRILELKYDLGLFEDPFRYCDINRKNTEILTPSNRALARKIAANSFVLLKNNNQILPLKNNTNIALIGSLIHNRENMGGTWAVSEDKQKSVTILEGMKKQFDKLTVTRGTNIYSNATLDNIAASFGKQTDRESKSDATLINEAVAIAKKVDVVVAVLGESAEMSGESSSRSKIGLPENQLDLLKALKATGKPIVMILMTGRPLAIEWENENVDAILNMWFAGTEAGNALADVLSGKVNPSGKLPATFPRNEGQIPIYYATKTTGRPHSGNPGFEKFRSNYIDVSNEPLYPFGYGLSYTKFDISEPTLNAAELTPNQTIILKTKVTNTGNITGSEVIQLYIRDNVGSITRPLKELKGFQKIELKAGESREVSFNIDEEMLKFYNADLEFMAEAGDFEALIGSDSKTLKKVNFSLKK